MLTPALRCFIGSTLRGLPLPLGLLQLLLHLTHLGGVGALHLGRAALDLLKLDLLQLQAILHLPYPPLVRLLYLLRLLLRLLQIALCGCERTAEGCNR